MIGCKMTPPTTMTSLPDEPARDFFARSDVSVLSGIDDFLDPESRLRLSEASTDTQVTFETTGASIRAKRVERQLDDTRQQLRRLHEEWEAALEPLRKREDGIFQQQRRLRQEFKAAMEPLWKSEHELCAQLQKMRDRRHMRKKSVSVHYDLTSQGYRFSKSYRNTLLNLQEEPLALFRL
jgi:hypothetical protein